MITFSLIKEYKQSFSSYPYTYMSIKNMHTIMASMSIHDSTLTLLLPQAYK